MTISFTKVSKDEEEKVRILYIFLAVTGLCLVIFIGILVFLVHTYLKPEKVRHLTISRAEALLGRKVELNKIEIGVFKGIFLKGLSVKEEDGQTDFVRLESMRIKFRLFPLLKRELIITKAEIGGPYLRVVRTKEGNFNWETLRIFEKEDIPRKTSKPDTPSKEEGLGRSVLALIIPNFEVRNGKLFFRDETGNLPNMEIPWTLKASLSPERLSAKGWFELFKEPFNLDLQVENYQTRPELKLHLSGQSLNLEPFLNSKARLIFLNPRLSARFKAHQLNALFEGELAGGKVQSRLKADFKSDYPMWELRKSASGLEIGEIVSALNPDLPGRIKGRLRYEGEFFGKGLDSEEIKRTLVGQGHFETKDLELSGIPVTEALAKTLSLPELKTILFSEGNGTFEIKNQRAFLKADLVGPMLSAKLPHGVVDFEGHLDTSFDLTFSPKVSKTLTQRLSFVRHLQNDKGEVELTVLVKGFYRKPRVILKPRPLNQKLKGTIEEKLKGLLGF